MLYNLLPPLTDLWPGFNLFRYLTFRTGGAVMTALLISFMFGPGLIAWLRRKQEGRATVREDTPETHLAKTGTPSMGGALILVAISGATILWADMANPLVWLVLGVTISFGLVGLWDDYLKLTWSDSTGTNSTGTNSTGANSKGLKGRHKLALQIIIALVAALACQHLSPDDLRNGLSIPFFKSLLLPLGVFFVPFAMLVMVGASNAVNLTDGLDGLAIAPVMIAAGTFGLFSYLVGNALYADYLQVFFVPGSGELAVICGAILGAGMGFLWFNAPPAQVFMGDTGSLSLGGALGAIAVVTKQEIVLAIVGGLFVLEAVSVIVQVASFRLTGRRVFRMAPIHHHFEKKGWPESTIVIRFWIIAGILAMIGLSTLKLR